MSTNRVRLDAEDRKTKILLTAVQMAKRDGLRNLRRDALAERCECSTGLVNAYFATMGDLRHAIMRHAVKNEVLEIVAEGLALADKQAHKAPDALKKRALAFLTR